MRRCTARFCSDPSCWGFLASTIAESAQHFLDIDGAIEQRESNEQRFDEQLRLTTSTKQRLQLEQRMQHAKQIGWRRRTLSLRERSAHPFRQVGCCTAE